jgi:hypothetical protein
VTGAGGGDHHNLGGCGRHRSMKSVSVASVQEMLPGGCHYQHNCEHSGGHNVT